MIFRYPPKLSIADNYRPIQKQNYSRPLTYINTKAMYHLIPTKYFLKIGFFLHKTNEPMANWPIPNNSIRWVYSRILFQVPFYFWGSALSPFLFECGITPLALREFLDVCTLSANAAKSFRNGDHIQSHWLTNEKDMRSIIPKEKWMALSKFQNEIQKCERAKGESNRWAPVNHWRQESRSSFRFLIVALVWIKI